MSEPVFSNAEEAAQALAASVQADAGGQVAPEPTVTPSVPENQPSATDATGTPAPEQSESFTDYQAAIDALPDESRAIVEARLNQMQGDYTRKTQEVSELRREAEQAIQFVQELETNPNFALQVHNEIQQALEASGWSPQEAQAEATAQVQEAITDGSQREPDFDSDDPIIQELNDLKAWRAEQEEQQLYQQMENEFDRMDVAVRQANPDLTEEDMSHVYALSYATGGDLIAAADAYKQETERIVHAYLQGKQAVASGTPGVPSTGTSAQAPPEPFDGLFDKRLEAAAERMLGESLGQ